MGRVVAAPLHPIARAAQRRHGASLAAVAAALLLSTAAAGAADLKLWPLFDYHKDDSRTEIDLLGPLVHYHRTAGESVVALRPLFYWKTEGSPSRNELAVLYPFAVSRWSTAQSDTRVLGLLTFQSKDDAAPADWERRVTLFPFVFYRYSRAAGSSLSVLPLYADLRDFFGYRRVQMIAFPAYLRLEEPLVQRSWLPFPFVGWTGGGVGRGWRIWPLYGWEEDGESERFRYVLWPFYIHHELHPGRPERDERDYRFGYFRRNAPNLQTRAAFPFLTHTVDRVERTDTWGFPWPLWLAQRNLDTGERLTLRLAPFYQDSRHGDLRSQFYLWPAYRHRIQEADDYRYERRDAILILWRWTEEVQPSQDHRRHRHTLFPLWRFEEDDLHESGQMPALLDALVPANQLVREIYSPLWRAYGYERTSAARARWSLGWNLISFDGARLRYPVYWDLGEEDADA